jgi:phosphoglycerol transferase MdoB-like AlkP superfamily enzyme
LTLETLEIKIFGISWGYFMGYHGSQMTLCAVPNPIVGYRKYHGDPEPPQTMEASVTSGKITSNYIGLFHSMIFDGMCFAKNGKSPSLS